MTDTFAVPWDNIQSQHRAFVLGRIDIQQKLIDQTQTIQRISFNDKQSQER
jgi:hypothetical protein